MFSWIVLGINDICMMDIFDGSCPDSHVILITHAKYGLMRRSRCVQPEISKQIYPMLGYQLVTIKLGKLLFC